VRRIVALALVGVFIFTSASSSFAQDKWENLLVESAKVFEEMTQMPDEGVPSDLIRDAHAIVILPSTVGGGFILGGKYGQGVILAKSRGARGWSAPAVFNLAGASLGWQIGGQATDIILLVMTERGLDGLLQSKFKLGGDASVAAGPVGREAEASTDLQLKGGILSYSRSRGAFIGVKLEGAMLSLNKEANTSLYGKELSARDILIKRSVEPPAYADRLMKNLKRYR
jgi:lipid-binding SYLF domain-containing protein